MSKSTPKPCDRCQKIVSLRDRIKFDRAENWILVCPECQQKAHRPRRGNLGV